MSLTTMTRCLSAESAILSSASQAMPPVSAPSPITATTWRSARPWRRLARAMPSAQDRAVEAWEFSTTSCTDSDLAG